MDVTSTTRPVMRSFSVSVRARRFQGWNSAEKPRRLKANAAAGNGGQRRRGDTPDRRKNSSGSRPATMTAPPAHAIARGRRANKRPADDQRQRDGEAHQQAALGRRELFQQQVVEDLHADGAGADQPALRRQDDAHGVRAGTRDRQQHQRRDHHGIEHEGDRVRAEPVADDVGEAEEGDGEHVEAGLDPAGDRVLPRRAGVDVGLV